MDISDGNKANGISAERKTKCPGAGVDIYLTASDVALFVQLSVQTIRRYTMNKEIPFHKINRAVRYKKSEIEQWVEKRETPSGKDQNENLEGGLFDEASCGGEA